MSIYVYRRFLGKVLPAALLALVLCAAEGWPHARHAFAESTPMRKDRYGDPLPAGAVARMGTMRLRVGGSIGAVAFSPDSTQVAVLAGTEVVLWERATGREVRRWPLEGIENSSLAFSPDGKWLAATGKESHSFPFHRGEKETHLRIWDVSSGKPIWQLSVEGLNAVVFNAKGQGLVGVNTMGHVIYHWDVPTRREVHRAECRLDPSYKFVLSEGGRYVAGWNYSSRDSSRVLLYDTSTGRKVRDFTPSVQEWKNYAFVGGDRWLITTSPDKREGRIHCWDVESSRELKQIGGRYERGPDWVGDQVTLSRDGKLLVCEQWGKSDPEGEYAIVLRNAADGALVRPLHLEERRLPQSRLVTSLVFAPNGKTVAGWDWHGSAIRLWDIATGAPLPRRERIYESMEQVAFTAQGRSLLTVSKDSEARLWDIGTGGELRRYHYPGACLPGSFRSPDGSTLAGADGHLIRLREAATGRETGQLRGLHFDPLFAAFLSDGRTLATLSGDGFIFWDLSSCRERKRIKEPSEGRLLGLSPDGQTALWDQPAIKNPRSLLHMADSPQQAPPLPQHLYFSQNPFTPDGRFLIAVDDKRQMLQLVNTRTGRVDRSFHVRVRPWWGRTAFAPDGRTLAYLADKDHTIHLLDMATGRERGRFTSDQGAVNDLAFSPDGKRLTSAGYNATALVWDVAAAQLPETVKRTERELESLWAKLTAEEGSEASGALRAADKVSEAYDALWDLVASREQTVALLRRHLKPIPTADAIKLQRLIEDLDSDEFATRERATTELEHLDVAAESTLRKALANKPSLEKRKRLEALLDKVKAAHAHRKRDEHALDVLDHIGTPDARRLLRDLAQGAPDAVLTRAARAVLNRGQSLDGVLKPK